MVLSKRGLLHSPSNDPTAYVYKINLSTAVITTKELTSNYSEANFITKEGDYLYIGGLDTLEGNDLAVLFKFKAGFSEAPGAYDFPEGSRSFGLASITNYSFLCGSDENTDAIIYKMKNTGSPKHVMLAGVGCSRI